MEGNAGIVQSDVRKRSGMACVAEPRRGVVCGRSPHQPGHGIGSDGWLRPRLSLFGCGDVPHAWARL